MSSATREDNPGNITNPPYPHAWRYRDWVIEALNKDVPYDRFVKLQLAADLMPGTSRPDMRALGFIALGPQDHKDVRLSVEVVGTLQLNDWDERLDTVSRGLLGLSVACARCHDHKFDPIQQRDYYRLRVCLRRRSARCGRSSTSIRRPRPASCGCISGCSICTTPPICSKATPGRSRTGGAAGEEVPRRADRAAGRNRRDVEGISGDRRLHQDRAVSGERRRSATPTAR